METESTKLDVPPEITDSLKRFLTAFPDPSKVCFIMMKFGTTKLHTEIVDSLRAELSKRGISGVRADDKQFHDDLLWNILTYVYGCGFGIAVFERIEKDEFNPNVAFEVGYMMGLKKPVLLLKDRTQQSLQTDLMGRLYKTFDPQGISDSIAEELPGWLEDKGFITSRP